MAEAMNNNELLEFLKTQLSRVKTREGTVIGIDEMINYVELLQDKLRNQVGLQDANLSAWQRESNMEMFRSVILSGQNALKACMWMHAGASIAVLAFIGNLVAGSATRQLIPGFADVLMWFLGGVLSVSLAYGATYLTQLCYYKGKKNPGVVFNWASIVLVIVSYGLFLSGGYQGYLAMLAMT